MKTKVDCVSVSTAYGPLTTAVVKRVNNKGTVARRTYTRLTSSTQARFDRLTSDWRNYRTCAIVYRDALSIQIYPS